MEDSEEVDLEEEDLEEDGNMKYVVLHWSKDDYSDAMVLLDNNGKMRIFDEICRARVAALDNCSCFKIVDFHSYQVGKKDYT